MIDPATDALRAVSAGHPPPIVLRADGTAEQLVVSPGPPLGVETERP